MRKRTLGIRHWHFITKRKIELSKGYFVQTSEVLLLVSVVFVFVYVLCACCVVCMCMFLRT